MSKSLEDKVRDKKYWRIGWAIMHMSWLEKVIWALTCRHKYMTQTWWDSEEGKLETAWETRWKTREELGIKEKSEGEMNCLIALVGHVRVLLREGQFFKTAIEARDIWNCDFEAWKDNVEKLIEKYDLKRAGQDGQLCYMCQKPSQKLSYDWLCEDCK